MGRYIDELKLDMNDFDDDASPMEILAGIFHIYTYEYDVRDFLIANVIEVSRAILNRKTFEFISDEKNNEIYLTTLQFVFFQLKLEWGTSIRGAWFNFDKSDRINYDFDNKISSTDDLEELIGDLICFYDEFNAKS